METLSNEFACLPVIVSDYDAIFRRSSIDLLFTPFKNSASTTLEVEESSSRSSSPPLSPLTASPTHTVCRPPSHWATDLADYADALWSKLTTGMKSKLRDACIELLKRVDDPSEEEKMAWLYDDDSRFLD